MKVVCAAPTFIAGDDLQTDAFTAVLKAYKAPEISVYVIYSQTKYLSFKIRVFIEFLVERFGG